MNARLLTAVFVACGFAAGCSENPIAPTTGLTAGTADQQRQAPRGPITIVQGVMSVDYTTPEFAPDPFGTASLQGTHGFRLDARLWSGGLFPGSICRFGFDCIPGSTIPLNGAWGGFDLPGTATLQGQRYEIGGFDPPGASLELTASITAPPQAETATIRTPFTLEGHFLTEDAGVRIEGRGTAIVTLRWHIEAWEVASVRYEFRGQSGR